MLVKDFAIENNAATSNTFEASSRKDNSMESSTTTATATTSFTTTTTSSTTTSLSASAAAATTAMININDDDDDDSYVVGDEEEEDDELFVSNELEGDEDELSVSDENEDDEQDELFTPQQEQDRHESQLMNSKRKIRALQGMTTDVVKGTGRKKQTITWKVIPYHDAPDPIKARSKAALGIRSQKVLDDLFDSDLPLADLFLYLTFRSGKWQRWLRVLNMKVKEMNEDVNTKRSITKFSPQEFLIGHALLICASDCSDRGSMLWDERKDATKHNKAWQSLAEKTVFSPYMKFYRFKQFRKLIPLMWEADESTAPTDPWYRFRAAVDNFNIIC